MSKVFLAQTRSSSHNTVDTSINDKSNLLALNFQKKDHRMREAQCNVILKQASP